MRGVWTRVAPCDGFGGRSSHTVTNVDGAVMICGGEFGPRELVPAGESLWKFEDGTLHPVKQTETNPLLGHSAFSCGGRLVVFGGRKGGTMGEGSDLNDLWEFSEKDGWRVLPVTGERPCPRSYAGSASYKEHFFLFGGCSEHDRLNDLWRFDGASGSWEQLSPGGPDMEGPSARGAALVFASSKDDVYIFGGFSGGELGDVWHYNVPRKSWRALDAGAFTARSVAGCAHLNGYAVIFGGERSPSAEGHKGAGQFFNDVLVFDPRNDTWRTLPCSGDVPAPRGWLEWAPAGPHSLVVVGGLGEDARRLNDAYVLEISGLE